MPELFDANANSVAELPAIRRERSAVREALSMLTVGQVLKYTSDEDVHVHRTAAPSQRNSYSCFIQDVVGRLNRDVHRAVRLRSVHDSDGSIYIYCEPKRRLYDN
jgi:hypothetical protein